MAHLAATAREYFEAAALIVKDKQHEPDEVALLRPWPDPVDWSTLGESGWV